MGKCASDERSERNRRDDDPASHDRGSMSILRTWPEPSGRPDETNPIFPGDPIWPNEPTRLKDPSWRNEPNLLVERRCDFVGSLAHSGGDILPRNKIVF